ncbi:MAG: hypothetical protein BGO34_07260 [Bacteroidia bacterium 44-10]|nr:MAG: hypothetical protein BGO34_07260 [Bacteroidia bacterium 44-10]
MVSLIKDIRKQSNKEKNEKSVIIMTIEEKKLYSGFNFIRLFLHSTKPKQVLSLYSLNEIVH